MEAVAAARYDAAAKPPRPQRHSRMWTRVVDRVDRAVDVEERDIFARDAHNLALAGRQPIEGYGFEEFRHRIGQTTRDHGYSLGMSMEAAQSSETPMIANGAKDARIVLILAHGAGA